MFENRVLRNQVIGGWMRLIKGKHYDLYTEYYLGDYEA
jgi:hypothetical protein